MDATLCLDGLHIDVRKLKKEYIKNLITYAISTSSISTKMITGCVKTISKYSKTGDSIILPRFTAKALVDKRIIKSIKPWYENIEYKRLDNVEYSGSLSTNQKLIINFLLENVFNNKYPLKIFDGCIIVMPTGTGKSHVGSGLIDINRVKSLVVVPNKLIMDEWISHLKKFHPHASIGEYHSKCKRDGDIVVIIAKSILSKKITDKSKFFNDFGLIIWDEIPTYCAPKISNIFKVASAPVMIGLTATPDERADKFDPVCTWYVGDIVSWKDIDGFISEKNTFTTNVSKIEYHGPNSHTQHNGADPLEVARNYINQIISDEFRNKMIANIAAKLYAQKRHLFIFTEQRDHAILLASLISTINIPVLLPEIEIEKELSTIILDTIQCMPKVCVDLILSYGYYIDPHVAMGGTSFASITAAKKDATILIVTYQYAGTGFSCDTMDTIIFGTPRKRNMRQYLGRIYRMASKTRDRYVIDIVDEKTTLKSRYMEREKIYKENNAIITLQKVCVPTP